MACPSTDLFLVLEQRYVTRVLCIARSVCTPQSNGHLYIDKAYHTKWHQILHKDQSITIRLQLLVGEVFVHAKWSRQIKVDIILCDIKYFSNYELNGKRVWSYTYPENGRLFPPHETLWEMALRRPAPAAKCPQL